MNKEIKKRNLNYKYLISKLSTKLYFTNFDNNGISNYAFPIILNTGSILIRNNFEKYLSINGIEFRRGNAGGGNQIRQPYLKNYRKLLKNKNFQNVEKVHFFGYYIGNYPYLKKSKLKKLVQILNKFKFKS